MSRVQSEACRMSRTPIPHQGEPLREGKEPLASSVNRRSSFRGYGRNSTDPVANPTIRPMESGRASSRLSSRASSTRNDTLDELVTRARKAKRESRAIEREIADVMVEMTSSIALREKDIDQWLRDTIRVGEVDQRQPETCTQAPANRPMRPQNHFLPPYAIEVPLVHSPVRIPEVYCDRG